MGWQTEFGAKDSISFHQPFLGTNCASWFANFEPRKWLKSTDGEAARIVQNYRAQMLLKFTPECMVITSLQVRFSSETKTVPRPKTFFFRFDAKFFSSSTSRSLRLLQYLRKEIYSSFGNYRGSLSG